MHEWKMVIRRGGNTDIVATCKGYRANAEQMWEDYFKDHPQLHYDYSINSIRLMMKPHSEENWYTANEVYY